MTSKTLALTGACLALVGAIVLSYVAWLPNVSELRTQNLMTTKYVQIYVRRIGARGQKPSVAMSWVGLEEISPHLRHAVLIAEDQRFYRHRGVDWEELKKALRYNLRKGQMARGASTITQQVARNLFLSPRRSAWRKLKEILIARHLERSLEKDRIFEIYLNIVEWGEGIFGAEAASRKYFGKPASQLSPKEAVDLAASLPSPYRMNPGAPPDELMLKKRELYMERMRRAGYLEEE